jgi:hypothetical protein
MQEGGSLMAQMDNNDYQKFQSGFFPENNIKQEAVKNQV